jgi:hypothetical protein
MKQVQAGGMVAIFPSPFSIFPFPIFQFLLVLAPVQF